MIFPWGVRNQCPPKRLYTSLSFYLVCFCFSIRLAQFSIVRLVMSSCMLWATASEELHWEKFRTQEGRSVTVCNCRCVLCKDGFGSLVVESCCLDHIVNT